MAALSALLALFILGLTIPSSSELHSELPTVLLVLHRSGIIVN